LASVSALKGCTRARAIAACRFVDTIKPAAATRTTLATARATTVVVAVDDVSAAIPLLIRAFFDLAFLEMVFVLAVGEVVGDVVGLVVGDVVGGVVTLAVGEVVGDVVGLVVGDVVGGVVGLAVGEVGLAVGDVVQCSGHNPGQCGAATVLAHKSATMP
jgi:hypothetical protein